MKRAARLAVAVALLGALAGGAPRAFGQTPAAPDRSKPPEPGPPAPLRLPPALKLRLGNGIPVFLIERHKVPLVQSVVVLRGGASADPSGRPGLASFTASLLERGAGSRSALEISDVADFLGADVSAQAGWDATTVGVNIPAARLEAGLGLLSDLVLRPTFPADEIERVRAELLTELLQRRDDPEEIAAVAFDRAVFGSHPYGRSIEGDEASARAFTREEVVRFHSTRYAPSAAAIVIVGDVTPSALSPLLERAFGAWAGAGGSPVSAVPPAPQLASRRVYLVDKPEAAQSQIWIGRVGPPRSTPDYFPLVVANTILGGSFTSRLNHNLRETKGYTYGAFSHVDLRLSTGPFLAAAGVQTDKTAAALVEFFKELEGIRAPVPADELRRARNYAARRYPAAFETAAQVAGKVRDQFLYGLPDDYFNAYLSRIEAVTAEEVRRAARKWIDPAACAVVIVGDRAKIESSVRALNLGPVTLQTVDDVLGPAGGKPSAKP